MYIEQDGKQVWQDEQIKYVIGKDAEDNDIEVDAVRKETGVWFDNMLVEPSQMFEDSRKPSIETLKQAKVIEIKQACKSKIEAGFYSPVKYGTPKLYTLKDYEQSNMQALIININGGALTVPWRHSELIICDVFSAENFLTLYQQASVFTVNMRYKSDFIELWISETELTSEELQAISMDSVLPQYYQDLFVTKLSENGIPVW